MIFRNDKVDNEGEVDPVLMGEVLCESGEQKLLSYQQLNMMLGV